MQDRCDCLCLNAFKSRTLNSACCIQHYASIMKYISQPPLLLDVHIHKPLLPARTWMDSLLAFFPGLQVSLIWCNSRCFRWAVPFD